MPPTNDASTQTDLAYSDIDCLVAECNKARANEIRLSKVVDDLESELRERYIMEFEVNTGQRYEDKILYWATYLCCFHGTSQVYRAIATLQWPADISAIPIIRFRGERDVFQLVKSF